MLLWVIFACLTAIVLLVMLAPLAGARPGGRSRAAYDANVYRDQLRELDGDRERGLIGEREAEAARLEIARRLIATDTEEGAGTRGRRVPPAAVMIAVALGLPALTFGLYLFYGSPRLHDQPLASRLADPSSNQSLAALVARVQQRLREHPEDGQGWEVIAPVYMSWQRYSDAAEAYRQAISLLGENAKRLSGEGQALVLANDGVVSEQARRVLERALALDGSLVEPRVLLAIAKEQDGQFDKAAEDWRALESATADKPDVQRVIKQRLAEDEARLGGKPTSGVASPNAEGASASAAGGPSAQDIAAAQNMSPADRQAMIERMVQGLAAKLDSNGDDLAGWLKLVRAYTVLDRKDDALKALAKAKSQFSGNADALSELDALAAELGLKS